MNLSRGGFWTLSTINCDGSGPVQGRDRGVEKESSTKCEAESRGEQFGFVSANENGRQKKLCCCSVFLQFGQIHLAIGTNTF